MDAFILDYNSTLAFCGEVFVLENHRFHSVETRRIRKLARTGNIGSHWLGTEESSVWERKKQVDGNRGSQRLGT